MRQKSIDRKRGGCAAADSRAEERGCGVESKKSDREDEMEKIFDDQQRLRENMKALKGSAEEKALLQRYTQQLNEQENRLETLRKESQQLEAQTSSDQAALDKMIEELAFDVKLT